MKRKIKTINEGEIWDNISDLFSGAKDWGHIGLDIASIVSSMIPGVGFIASPVLDLANAGWYLFEGKKTTAALYVIMSIPVIGDIFAIPIQLALKAGGWGIMKIPGMKAAIERLIEKSPMILAYFEKLLWYKTTAPIGKAGKEFMESVEKANLKGGSKQVAEVIQESILKESGGKSLPGVFKKGAAEGWAFIAKKTGHQAARATKTGLKRIIPIGVGNIYDGGSVESSIEKESGSGGSGRSGRSGRSSGRSCPDNKLKIGCRGENVKSLQQKLLDDGYKLPRKGVDGWFGPETLAAVKKFQADNGLTVDGIAGKETLSSFGKNKISQAKKEIVLEPAKKEIVLEPEEKEASKVTHDAIPFGEPGSNLNSTLKSANMLPQREREYPYWQSNIWKNASEKEKTEELKAVLIVKGFLPMRTELEESYFIKPIKNRHRSIEALVFERMVTDANRLR